MSVAAVYVPAPSKRNLRIGQEKALWGWKDDAVAKGGTQQVLESLRPGGVVLLGHHGPNARVPSGGWADATFRELTIARVAGGYRTETTKIWPDDLYPHRIDLDILDIVDTKVTGAQLGAAVAEALRMSANKQGAPVVVDGPDVFERLVDATAWQEAAGEGVPSDGSGGTPDVTELEGRFIDVLSDFDRPTVALARREQAKLRKAKFNGAPVIGCALCGRELPAGLVRAAHIKRRSRCLSTERRDLANLMAACVLGCDALFEDGYVYVGEDGAVRSSPPASAPTDLAAAVGALEGRTCAAFGEDSADYFGWHREEIAKVGVVSGGSVA
ncbi:hypothetical protein ACFWXO_18785 [Kitasatospora sp. NPDC059088]|uniref:hypothetical protein n=1 Tax=Kitasatospora sp. NPDC059088 TaxID=3346722 RepID=UPI003689E93B